MRTICRRIWKKKISLPLLACALGACSTVAFAQKTVVVSATPTAHVGYTNLSVTAAITPWGSSDSGQIIFSDNGQPFQVADVQNSSGGIVETTITNIYPGKHILTAKYRGAKGVVSIGNTSGSYGKVAFAVPPAGKDYVGAWVDGSNGLGPVNLETLQWGRNTGLGRQVALSLEYTGWTNNTSQLWTDLSSANPAPINRFHILNAGEGYTANPQVKIIPVGNGSGATAKAIVSGGAIRGISVTSPGFGYTIPPIVTITGGGGYAASATAVLEGGEVSAIHVTSPGVRFTSTPKVIITPVALGSGASASVTVGANHEITGIELHSRGSGYVNAPRVLITGGGGKNATATAYINGDQVAGVTLTSGGSGYVYPPLTVTLSGGGGNVVSAQAGVSKGGIQQISIYDRKSVFTSPPDVEIIGGGGTGASALATVDSNGSIDGIRVIEGGSGYVTAPTVMIKGGGGDGATATATVSGGAVTAIQVRSQGADYVYPPLTVQISGGGGTGAVATATAGAPGYFIGRDLDQQRTPLVSWGCTGSGQNIEDITAGKDNPYIDAIAGGLENIARLHHGRPILLRWCWEMNLSYRDGIFNTTDPVQRESDYKAAWRYLVDRLRADFNDADVTPNVIFVFNPGFAANDQTDAVGRLFYPGNQWVDWIALDDYNIFMPYVQDFQHTPGVDQVIPANADKFGFYPVFTNTSPYFGLPAYPATGYDKPLMIGENGVGTCGAYKDPGCSSPSNSDLQAKYVGTAANEIPSIFPQIKAYVYFSASGPGGVWMLDGTVANGGGFAAFKSLACSKPFLYANGKAQYVCLY